jgi:hypothetical protein
LEILRIQRVSPLVVKKFKIIVQPRLRVDRRFVLDGIVNEYVRKTLVAKTPAIETSSIRIIDKTTTGGITTTEQSNVTNDTDVQSTSKKNEVHIGFIFPGKSQPFSERFYALFNHEVFEIFSHTSRQQQLKGFD